MQKTAQGNAVLFESMLGKRALHHFVVCEVHHSLMFFGYTNSPGLVLLV